MKTFEKWVDSIVYALALCPDVNADEVPDLIHARQKELDQEPDVSIYSHGMTVPTDKDYEV